MAVLCLSVEAWLYNKVCNNSISGYGLGVPLCGDMIVYQNI